MNQDQKKSFINWLDELQLSPGATWRGDCYACGGSNTMSVSNDLGSIRYYCFRASCSLSGVHRSAVDPLSIERLLRTGGRQETKKVPWQLPDHFVDVNGRKEIIDYLLKNNCYDAWINKRMEICYDPKQHRVVFLIKDDGEYYGATGRSLDKSNHPKWYIYGDVSYPFIVAASKRPDISNVLSGKLPKTSKDRQIAVVEDCASAASVSRVMDSCALLGTNLGNIALSKLSGYSVVYICLDKDATKKAIQLQRDLLFFTEKPVIVPLDKDLKYCSVEEIRRRIEHGKMSIAL